MIQCANTALMMLNEFAVKWITQKWKQKNEHLLTFFVSKLYQFLFPAEDMKKFILSNVCKPFWSTFSQLSKSVVLLLPCKYLPSCLAEQRNSYRLSWGLSVDHNGFLLYSSQFPRSSEHTCKHAYCYSSKGKMLNRISIKGVWIKKMN